GEVDHDLRPGRGLFEPLGGDGVDARVWRGGDDLMAALAQNGDGLRADQASAADDDDLHDLPSLVDDWRPLNANTSEKKSGLNARASCKPVRRQTPGRVPAEHAARRAARDGEEPKQTRMSRDLFPREVLREPG